jgi:hypothetical protein
MAVLGVRDTTNYTYGDKLAEVHNFDVTLSFEEPVRAGRLNTVIAAQPDIDYAEGWLVDSAKGRPAGQIEESVEDPRLTIFALPPQSAIYRLQIESGRWLEGEDPY